MKWNHLPVSGGLYDQDPDLLEKFSFIFRAIADEEHRKHEEDKRKAEAERRKNERGRGAVRRRR